MPSLKYSFDGSSVRSLSGNTAIDRIGCEASATDAGRVRYSFRPTMARTATTLTATKVSAAGDH